MYVKWSSKPSVLFRVFPGHLYYLFLDISPTYLPTIICTKQTNRESEIWKSLNPKKQVTTIALLGCVYIYIYIYIYIIFFIYESPDLFGIERFTKNHFFQFPSNLVCFGCFRVCFFGATPYQFDRAAPEPRTVVQNLVFWYFVGCHSASIQ